MQQPIVSLIFPPLEAYISYVHFRYSNVFFKEIARVSDICSFLRALQSVTGQFCQSIMQKFSVHPNFGMIKVYKTIVVDLDTWRIIYNAARASLLGRHLYNHQDILTEKFPLMLEQDTGQTE